MSILAALLPDLLGKVIDKVIAQLPVSDNEKEQAKVTIDQELAKNAGTIADAEATISTNAKDAWLEELHNGGFLATTWRPLLAVVSTFIMAWDAVILNVLNAPLQALQWQTIAHAPSNVVEVAMWVLLTLIGARGVEKISVIGAKVKR